MKWRWQVAVVLILFVAALALPYTARAESSWDRNARVLGELQSQHFDVAQKCTAEVAANYRAAGNMWLITAAAKIQIAPGITVGEDALTCGLIEFNYERGEQARRLYHLPVGQDLSPLIWQALYSANSQAFLDLFDLSPRLFRYVSEDGRTWDYSCGWRVSCVR